MNREARKLMRDAVFLFTATLAFGTADWAAPQAGTPAGIPAKASTAKQATNAKLPPLEIAREGYLFAGGSYATVKDAKVMVNQIYAEFQIPVHRKSPYPIIMVHGGSQSGTNFTGTPDGREGWAQFFLRHGYAVYVVDQVGRGRSNYQDEMYGPNMPADLVATQKRFTNVERYNLWPQAHLHTQWPGAGVPGDPIFDQFFASQLPSIANYALQQGLNRDGILALLEKIGPAILLTHSQSGAFGWPVGDARPDLVKAIVAIEPNGPPFFNVDNTGAPDWFREVPENVRPWGPTPDALTYDPPVSSPSDLAIVRREKPDDPNESSCWMQISPARQLPKLQKIPILVITSEASYHRAYDHCTVEYLEQAGVPVKWVKLADVGIHGNGHMMMLEKNNMEIAGVMAQWIEKTVPSQMDTSAKK
ncbi:MAG TPA: alpha/beta hydrolase [Candidatus Acidoferrales bacterium]|jgi:pimeloyl-ACP methyl ester carboxylesterase|nr:alpha/beta hydrolase [Candidatus Acidoferrales bacterium]